MTRYQTVLWPDGRVDVTEYTDIDQLDFPGLVGCIAYADADDYMKSINYCFDAAKRAGYQ